MRVELREVTVVYPKAFVPALSGVSFTVPEGGLAVLTGPTGAGKTTTLCLLYRELIPRSGSVWVEGVALERLPFREVQRLRRRMGIVFQEPRLIPEESAYGNVLLPLLWRGVPYRQARTVVLELFAELGISYLRHARPAALSAGEQQLVALARAVALSPSLLLADEPTGNVEPATTEFVAGLLRRIHARGTTVIVATHSAELLAAFPEALLIELRDGRLARLTPAPATAVDGGA